MEITPVKTSKFYDKNIKKFEIISMEEAKRNASRWKNVSRPVHKRLDGPTQFCRHFRYQAHALEAAVEQSKKETVCTFVYQKENGIREFIVAHPEVYWYYLMQNSPEARTSYEVIPENSPCWLYFDLEFKRELNPDSDGSRMTNTVIKIFCSYIQKYWGLHWDEKNVVNLDSSTNVKFSRHLIFCNKDIAFRNNLDAGRLVKGICGEIAQYLENSSVLHDILSRYERKELEELFVITDKGKSIFIDLAVYTRNRHFRMYKCTKWGKMSHLVVAPESKHVPLNSNVKKDFSIFLDSLISYFPNKSDLLLLELEENEYVAFKSYTKCTNYSILPSKRTKNSPYPQLDEFILSLVKPGKIRLCKYYENRKTIFYEILGNRYCANIGRQHKNNNVYWVVDLSRKKVYQKCHDEDCADFVSSLIDIPLEIAFQFDNEDDQLFLNVSESETDEKTVVQEVQ